MGILRFYCPASKLTDALLAEAHLTSYHRVPLPATVRREGDSVLAIEKDLALSGCLHVPWHVERYGLTLLSTGTLAERSPPYHLPTELARGTLGFLQNQASQYREVGLRITPRVQTTIQGAVTALRHAIACRGDEIAERDRLAAVALERGLDASRQVADLYIDRALAARRRLTERFPVLLGVSLDGNEPETPRRQTLEAASAALIRFSWREIEREPGVWDWSSVDRALGSAAACGLTCLAGPVVQFDPHHVPDHVLPLIEIPASLAEAARRFTAAALDRYAGRFQTWVAAARFNTPRIENLATSTRVRVMERVLEEYHEPHRRASWIVAIDQPWGEYMAAHPEPQGPLHWADALIQATGDLGGFMLDLNIAHHPWSTLPRPPLPFLQMLDLWGGFGCPIYVRLNVPAASRRDPAARLGDSEVPGRWTARMQQEWVHRYVSLLLTKPLIAGIFWNDPMDSLAHDFPHGGLFDASDQPRPAFRKLAALRKAYLK